MSRRRKGEQPIPRLLDSWSQDHPVANMIRTGSSWFAAWQMQKLTPAVKLARQTGIAPARLAAISAGDRVSRAELDALARAWNISAGDLAASMPDKRLLVE
ncbi:helix-turn-helix domain-containing protein [Sphingobium estronivorans]|uniref:helix-turn-helix domain-containing protein n=1 Tax=Sphingobium estronivorans TaxID=1577690 RepID=UPI001239659E